MNPILFHIHKLFSFMNYLKYKSSMWRLCKTFKTLVNVKAALKAP